MLLSNTRIVVKDFRLRDWLVRKMTEIERHCADLNREDAYALSGLWKCWLPKGKGEESALKGRGIYFLVRWCSSCGTLKRELLIFSFPVPSALAVGRDICSSCPLCENKCVAVEV
jgi:hypothetical protein